MGCKQTCPLIVDGQIKNQHNKQHSRISPVPNLSQMDVSQVTTITTEGRVTTDGRFTADWMSNDEDSFCSQPHFTELQTDIINSTWPIISADMQTQGVLMFLDLFRLEPDAQQMFDFR